MTSCCRFLEPLTQQQFRNTCSSSSQTSKLLRLLVQTKWWQVWEALKSSELREDIADYVMFNECAELFDSVGEYNQPAWEKWGHIADAALVLDVVPGRENWPKITHTVMEIVSTVGDVLSRSSYPGNYQKKESGGGKDPKGVVHCQSSTASIFRW